MRKLKISRCLISGTLHTNIICNNPYVSHFGTLHRVAVFFVSLLQDVFALTPCCAVVGRLSLCKVNFFWFDEARFLQLANFNIFYLLHFLLESEKGKFEHLSGHRKIIGAPVASQRTEKQEKQKRMNRFGRVSHHLARKSVRYNLTTADIDCLPVGKVFLFFFEN